MFLFIIINMFLQLNKEQYNECIIKGITTFNNLMTPN